jgi:hypothetical protein
MSFAGAWSPADHAVDQDPFKRLTQEIAKKTAQETDKDQKQR